MKILFFRNDSNKDNLKEVRNSLFFCFSFNLVCPLSGFSTIETSLFVKKTKERKGLVWYPVIDHGDCIEGDSGYHRYSKIKIDGRRRMVLCSQ